MTAWTAAPRMNRISARSITFLRPRLSASNPLAGEIIRAKREVQAVMRDLSSVERGRLERDEPMETSVAEITPVSSEADKLVI